MPEYRELVTAEDVTPDVLADAEEILDGWFSNDERIDWENFVDRLAQRGTDYDIPSYDNAAVRKIKRHIHKVRTS